MKKYIAFLVALTFWCCKDGKSESPETEEVALQSYTIEQMMDNEAIGGGSFSPDKTKLLVSSNRSGIYNMYTIPAAGGELEPISVSDSSSVFAISYFPKDERMLFRMDNNGDERFHIYLKDTDGSDTDLTPEDGSRNNFMGWAKDDASFYFVSNKRDSKYMDLYEMDLASLTAKMRYQNDEGYTINAISLDKEYLVLGKSINTNDSDLFLHNLTTKSSLQINRTQSSNAGQDFAPDGKSILYTTDEGSEFSYLMEYHIADKSYGVILPKMENIG